MRFPWLTRPALWAAVLPLGSRVGVGSSSSLGGLSRGGAPKTQRVEHKGPGTCVCAVRQVAGIDGGMSVVLSAPLGGT